MLPKFNFTKFNFIKFNFVLIFLIFLIPRTISLGSDIANYDSSYWYPRMDEFTKELLRGEYKQTYQKYHPGVTLLWASGSSKYAFEKAFETVFKYNPRFIPHQFTRLHFFTKFPLVFLISILGMGMFYILSKLINKEFAIIFSIVLSLEPFFLGVSRFLHMSALTAMFMFFSFLSIYYHYNQKSKSKKWFYISAITLGLGALTKIDALIAAPVNAMVITYYEFQNYRISKQYLTELVRQFFIYTLVSFGVFYILFPSMWVAPLWTMQRIIDEGIKGTGFSSSGADSLTGLKGMFYPEMVVFRSLPTFVMGIFGGLVIILFRKSFKLLDNKTIRVLFWWTIIFIVINTVVLTIPDKIKDRYVINLYPPLAMLSALFVYYSWTLKNKIAKYFVIGLFALFYLLTIYKYHPVYSFYYSELIGGPGGREKLGLPIKNRGEYYAQAALYINKHDSKPEVRNVVLSHREQVRTFAPFFIGKTYTNPRHLQKDYFADYIITRPDFDYLIKDSPLAQKCTLEKQFGPHEPLGYKIINLYKCQGVTNSYKDFNN